MYFISRADSRPSSLPPYNGNACAKAPDSVPVLKCELVWLCQAMQRLQSCHSRNISWTNKLVLTLWRGKCHNSRTLNNCRKKVMALMLWVIKSRAHETGSFSSLISKHTVSRKYHCQRKHVCNSKNDSPLFSWCSLTCLNKIKCKSVFYNYAC